MSTPLLVGPMIHLGTLPPFRVLGHAHLTMIAMETEEVVFERDRWIVERGESISAMYMLVDGCARVVGAAPGGTLGPGDVVGFPEILTPGPAATGVRADTDVLALRLDTDAFRELCAHSFAILSSVLSYLAEQVAEHDAALRDAVAGGDAPPTPPIELDRVGRMLALYRAPAFPSGSMDALAELAGQVTPVQLSAGARLWEPGQPADAFAVVCSGTLELTRDGSPPIAVGPGGVPGLPESLCGRAYGRLARATTEATVLNVALDPFMDVVEDHYELSFSLLGWLARHVVTGRP